MVKLLMKLTQMVMTMMLMSLNQNWHLFLQKNQLLDYGFTNDKILDENQCLTFLGHKIKPSDLFGGAKLQLDETVQSFENTISTYNNGNITLQGRKLVANSLLLSKIYSFSTACNFSKNDFSKLQQM